MERGSWTRQPKRPACQGRVVTCTAIHPKLLRQAQKRRKKQRGTPAPLGRCKRRKDPLSMRNAKKSE